MYDHLLKQLETAQRTLEEVGRVAYELKRDKCLPDPLAARITRLSLAIEDAKWDVERLIDNQGTKWTDNPRKLDMCEAYDVVHLSRLEAIKLHRRLTNSTFSAAVREVDELRRIGG